MYSPGLGRFISRDPLEYVDGYSTYAAYFIPNELDPTGEWAWCETSQVQMEFEQKKPLGRSIGLDWELKGSIRGTYKKCQMCCGDGTLKFQHEVNLQLRGQIMGKAEKDFAIGWVPVTVKFQVGGFAAGSASFIAHARGFKPPPLGGAFRLPSTISENYGTPQG